MVKKKLLFYLKIIIKVIRKILMPISKKAKKKILVNKKEVVSLDKHSEK